jgi:serine/threonine-protein kinase
MPPPAEPLPAASRPQAAQPARQQLALVAPPRIDFRAAASAAAAAPACGLLAANGTDSGLTLEGVVRASEMGALRSALAARNVPADAAKLAVQTFDGPYCPVLDLLRPVLAAAGGAPRTTLVGASPLHAGDLLRFDVSMPDWPGLLHVVYLMQSGEVAHLVPSAAHQAGATIRLGEPGPGFPGWEVSEPFGTDLLLALVSDGPLFATPRPMLEPQDAYIAALGEAVRAARQAGRRVVVRPLVVATAAR